MAHPLLHFTAGMYAGTVLTAVPAAKALLSLARNGTSDVESRRPSSRMGLMILVSYALGFFALVPALLSAAGVPETISSSFVMNLFVFYHVLNRIEDGGMLVGEIGLISIFVLHYAIVLSACLILHRKQACSRR